jgi:hypothetical protein
MRNFSEVLQIAKGVTVTSNSPLVIDRGFPMGGILHQLNLHLHITLTQTSASGAITDGMLLFCKNILFRAGNDHFVKNLCGRGLYYYNNFIKRAAPVRDTWATTTATTYNLFLPIPFSDRSVDYPVDTAIDTRRYSSTGFHFEFLPGSVSDMLSTVGDASIAVTADLFGIYENGNLPPIGGPGMPKGFREFSQPGPQIASTISDIDIEKNPKYFLRRILGHTATSPVAGSPFSGTSANSVVTDISFFSNIRTHVDKRPEQNIRWENASEFELSSPLTGYYLIDFIRNKSNLEMLPTDPANLSTLKYAWTYAAGSSPQISLLVDGYRLY